MCDRNKITFCQFVHPDVKVAINQAFNEKDGVGGITAVLSSDRRAQTEFRNLVRNGKVVIEEGANHGQLTESGKKWLSKVLP